VCVGVCADNVIRVDQATQKKYSDASEWLCFASKSTNACFSSVLGGLVTRDFILFRSCFAAIQYSPMKATAAVDSEHHHVAHPPPPISPTTALAPDRSMDQANPSVTKADQMQMDTTALGSCLPSPSQSTSSFTSSKSLPVTSKEDDVVASDDLDSLQIPLPLSHGPPTPTSTQDLEPRRPSLIQPHLTQVSEVPVSSPKMNPS